jgi:hypothetical protein
MKNVALKWALVGGLVNILLGLTFYIVNIPLDSKVRYFTLLVSIAVVIGAAMEFRDKVNFGFASVGQIIKLSLAVGLIMGAINGVWGIVYPAFIDTTMQETILLQTEINLEEAGMDRARIKEALKWTEYMFKPGVIFGMAIIGALFLSLLIAIPAGLILKRDYNQANPE